MGIYLNPDIELFSMSVASDIYVDKKSIERIFCLLVSTTIKRREYIIAGLKSTK